MESLMKHIGLKVTGAEEENKSEPSGSTDQKIQPFKEKKTAQNWFQRQFSRNMSHDYDSTEMEHATAIAAAAFAIHSQEEVSEIPQKWKISDRPETSLTKTKSKAKDTKSPFSLPGLASKQSGNEEPITEEKNPEKATAPSLKKTSRFSANLEDIDGMKPWIPVRKMSPSFDDKNLMNTIDDIKPETPPPVHQPVSLKQPTRPRSPPPSRQASKTRPGPVRTPTPASGTRGQPLTRQGTFETKADAWERNELQKIKERYEKLIETIDSWENKKKMKARRKLNKHEQSEDERKRVRAMKKYQSKMKYIDDIAAGARAESVERRRNEELRAKEKANIIRTTGKLPKTCFCF